MNRRAIPSENQATAYHEKSDRLMDWCCLVAALVFSLLIAVIAAKTAFGYIPDENTFFSADTIRVQTNLDGSTENYYRLKVHPLYGWICILYQTLFVRLRMASEAFAIPGLSIVIGLVNTALLYAVLRKLSVRPLAAMSFTMFFSSSATYVFWSAIPETHMAGGASVLLAVLLAITYEPAESLGKATLKSAIIFTISLSMVVTDVAVWLLAQADFAALRQGQLRRFVSDNLVRARFQIKAVMWGIGLLVILWAPQYPLLGKRIGIPFNFLEERHYVVSALDTRILSLDIFGIVAPVGPFAFVQGLVCIAILVVCLLLLTPELWFIPLFPLFGIALHVAYGSDSSFLFSSNYMSLFVVALALVVERRFQWWLPIVAFSLSIPLAWVNLHELNSVMGGLFEAHQMIKLPELSARDLRP